MVTLSYPAIAYRAELWCRHRPWRPWKVSSKSLVVRLVEGVELSLQPRDVALGFFVVHPQLNLAYLVAQVAESLFPDMPVWIGQAAADFAW